MTAVVCIDTKTGRLQRYRRGTDGQPVHAGRAFVDLRPNDELGAVIEQFRAHPEQFAVLAE